MIILIAGGTGFIGQALTHYLASNQHTVIVLSRDPRKVQQIFGSKIESISWEHIELEYIKKFDAIINLAGANIADQRWTEARQREILDSRIGPTELLSDYCTQLAATAPTLINASAVGIYDFIPPTGFQKKFYDEDSPINYNQFPHFLAKVARAWEKATWPARDAGVRVVNTRFGVVLGPQGGVLKKLLPMFRLGLGARIGSGQQPFPWVSLPEVVQAIDFSLKTPAIHGPVNIVSPEVISQAQFADTLAKVLHRPRLLTLPAFAIKCLFGQMGVELLLEGVAVKPSRLLAQNFQFKHIHLASALKQMDLTSVK